MEKLYTRRNFIKTLTAGAISLASPLSLSALTPQNKHYDFSKDSEKTLLARTIFGETRNSFKRGLTEAIMIGHTPINRVNDKVKWNGENLKQVLLKKGPSRNKHGNLIRDENGEIKIFHQYSCFNSWDPNLKILKNPKKYDSKSWRKSLILSERLLNNEWANLNFGQDHYHAKDMRKFPDWANSPKMKKIEGEEYFDHILYKFIAA
ncbi:cell wall hydrolase [archaeon]|nr:cell wall hydrolase [archaeon]